MKAADLLFIYKDNMINIAARYIYVCKLGDFYSQEILVLPVLGLLVVQTI